MSKSTKSGASSFLLIGGDARLAIVPEFPCTRIPSVKHGGRGALKRALSRIRTRSCSAVFVLTKFLGHSEYRAIQCACRNQGVPLHIVSGTSGCLRRLLAQLGLSGRVE